tara:strand:+ start:2175 stop:2402 length:228 start_codon:yes stop_codon:yes gene_type:complete
MRVRADFVRSVELSDSLDSLETAVANVETEYVVVKKKIDKILKLGWEQVEKRIDALHELETVQQSLDNKWRDLDE